MTITDVHHNCNVSKTCETYTLFIKKACGVFKYLVFQIFYDLTHYVKLMIVEISISRINRTFTHLINYENTKIINISSFELILIILITFAPIKTINENENKNYDDL